MRWRCQMFVMIYLTNWGINLSSVRGKFATMLVFYISNCNIIHSSMCFLALIFVFFTLTFSCMVYQSICISCCINTCCHASYDHLQICDLIKESFKSIFTSTCESNCSIIDFDNQAENISLKAFLKDLWMMMSTNTTQIYQAS
jgi:hypothetical protein